MRWRILSLAVAVLVASIPAVLAATGEDARPQRLTNPELVGLFDTLAPTLPGTRRITSFAAVRGHAGADRRIHQIGMSRGYRLRNEAVVLDHVEGRPLHPSAAAGYRRLAAAAQANGTPIRLVSGYRSISRQQQILASRLRGISNEAIASGRADGHVNDALRWVALPGGSKHHTGYAADLGTAGGRHTNFGSSAAYRWMAADDFAVARAHGWLPSYPPGVSDMGPSPEPWEFVYVGRPVIQCANHQITVSNPGASSLCPVGDVLDVAVDGPYLVVRAWGVDPDGPESDVGYQVLLDDREVAVGRSDDLPTVPAPTDGPVDVAVGVRAAPGDHRMCVRIRNDQPVGLDPIVGCRDVTVGEGPPVSGFGTAHHRAETLEPGAPVHVDDVGRPEDSITVADTAADGVDTPVVRRGRQYVLLADWSGDVQSADTLVYGRPDDIVFFGDWDGDGTDTPVVRRGRHYHFTNTLEAGPADFAVPYGRPDDIVFFGDWDGDGTDTPVVRRGRHYHFTNTLEAGPADFVVPYGRPDDIVFFGDWDGDGTDTPVVRRGRHYHFTNTLEAGPADFERVYGKPDDAARFGDWDGNGTDEYLVRRPA